MIEQKIKCESCGIVEGGKLKHEFLSEYRGYLICDWCPEKWKNLEKKLGRTISFDDFKNGKIKKTRGEKGKIANQTTA